MPQNFKLILIPTQSNWETQVPIAELRALLRCRKLLEISAKIVDDARKGQPTLIVRVRRGRVQDFLFVDYAYFVTTQHRPVAHNAHY